MYLEYNLSLGAESQGDLEDMIQTDNVLRDLDSGFGCSTFTAEAYSPEPGMGEEIRSLLTDHFPNWPQVEPLKMPLLQEDDHSLDTTHLLPTAYHLLDKALQRLISTRPSKNIQAKTDQGNTHSLAKMTDLAPAIFNPLYRQVSISLIYSLKPEATH